MREVLHKSNWQYKNVYFEYWMTAKKCCILNVVQANIRNEIIRQFSIIPILKLLDRPFFSWQFCGPKTEFVVSVFGMKIAGKFRATMHAQWIEKDRQEDNFVYSVDTYF